MKKSETLPCNPAAEVAVLGAILLDNQCFNQAAAVVTQEDFSLDTHRRIYRAMAELLERGARVDYVTLTEQLGADGVKQCGGVAYVTSLTDGLPRVRNIRNYAQIVREKAQSRLLIHMCGSANSAVRTGSKPETVLAEVQQRTSTFFTKGAARARRSCRSWRGNRWSRCILSAACRTAASASPRGSRRWMKSPPASATESFMLSARVPRMA